MLLMPIYLHLGRDPPQHLKLCLVPQTENDHIRTLSLSTWFLRSDITRSENHCKGLLLLRCRL